MSRPVYLPLFAVAWLLALAASSSRAAETKPLAFQLTFDKAVSAEPFTGRVYVMLSARPMPTLPSGPNWFRPEPFFALDVKGWKAGDPLTLGENSLGFPKPLSQTPAGSYYAVAVMDMNRGGRSFSASEGNGWSKPVRIELDPAKGGVFQLHLDQVYAARKFAETERVKLVEVESKLLSTFHGRPMRLRAAVILPPSFAEQSRRWYPVLYEVPGFGGTHFMALAGSVGKTNLDGVEFLHVILDPSCRLGHHCFADSDNNGPYGQALIEELIPEIERRFRAIGQPRGRFLTGHSSGGWSSLWLQVAYPDFFGGVWSTAPDPVDFRDFQRINLYQPGANMFRDEKGNPRPIARRGAQPVLWYKDFSDMEVVMGRGGQLMSFEAVFSPRGKDGWPVPLWDRKTGAVDPAVAKAWQRYDIRLVLERNWETLGPKLKGKIHIYMGGEDTFYLEGATALLKESLKQLGSDAVVEIFPGKDHGSVLDRALRERMAKEMAKKFREGNGK